MEIRAQWGSSWEIQLCNNPSGWEKLVREIGLVDSECLFFTHKGNLRFTLNIFKRGTEMLQPHRSTAFFASPSWNNTGKDVRNEEVVLSADLSYLGTRSPETSGARKYKRKLSFYGKKKKKGDESQSPKKKPVSGRRYSAGASSSSSLGEFRAIKQSIAQNHMPQEDADFVIHHPDKKRSWIVKYLHRVGISTENGTFSAGWIRLAREYPLAVGDECKFTKLKDDELLLEVIKP